MMTCYGGNNPQPPDHSFFNSFVFYKLSKILVSYFFMVSLSLPRSIKHLYICMWLSLPRCHSDLAALPSNLYYFRILYFSFYQGCFKSPAVNDNSALFPVLCTSIFCHQSWSSEDSHHWPSQQWESLSHHCGKHYVLHSLAEYSHLVSLPALRSLSNLGGQLLWLLLSFILPSATLVLAFVSHWELSFSLHFQEPTQHVSCIFVHPCQNVLPVSWESACHSSSSFKIQSHIFLPVLLN